MTYNFSALVMINRTISSKSGNFSSFAILFNVIIFNSYTKNLAITLNVFQA